MPMLASAKQQPSDGFGISRQAGAASYPAETE